jgi:16S rRNA (adenine1518-N6/adenine1519-N6)-dimethyltransferase
MGPMRRGLLTPVEVRRLMEAHKLAPRKAAGQNFVVDPNTVRKVVRDAGIQAGELVCEVGPGLGSLTLALREAGARVLAIEVDAGLIRALGDVLGGDPDVMVLHGDALEIDFARVVGDGPAAFVSNLPYNIATPIVMRALESEVFDRLLVMVQREVGQRWVATVGDPHYGAVSVKVAAMAHARIVATISRSAFYPVPNVDSVTVRLDPVAWQHPVDRRRLLRLVGAGFAQRRKRLRNALATDARRPADVEAALGHAGLDPAARAEELALGDWVALAAALERPR